MEVLVVFLGIKKAVLVSFSSLIKIMKVSVNVIFLNWYLLAVKEPRVTPTKQQLGTS